MHRFKLVVCNLSEFGSCCSIVLGCSPCTCSHRGKAGRIHTQQTTVCTHSTPTSTPGPREAPCNLLLHPMRPCACAPLPYGEESAPVPRMRTPPPESADSAHAPLCRPHGNQLDPSPRRARAGSVRPRGASGKQRAPQEISSARHGSRRRRLARRLRWRRC